MNRSHLSAVVLGVALATSARAQLMLGPASDSDQLEASAEQISRMKAAMKVVLGRVDEARNEKDIVKMNCVNEKLTQIKALLRVAEQADVALHEAVANRDPGGAAEFAKIAISRSKVDMLRAEAEQCIGQLAYMVDEKTNVEVEQPANLPGGGGALSLGVATRTMDQSEIGSTMTGGQEMTSTASGPGYGPIEIPPMSPPPIITRPCPASPSIAPCP